MFTWAVQNNLSQFAVIMSKDTSCNSHFFKQDDGLKYIMIHNNFIIISTDSSWLFDNKTCIKCVKC